MRRKKKEKAAAAPADTPHDIKKDKKALAVPADIRKEMKKEHRKQKRGRTLRFLGLRVFADALFCASFALTLPCVLCFFYPPAKIFSELPLIGLVIFSDSAGAAAAAAFILLSLIFVTAGFSARFTALCIYMYTPAKRLAPPENMLTVKNGIRYGAFCLLFGLKRLSDAVRFFFPSAAAVLLLAAGVWYGLTKTEVIAAFSASACLFLLGIAYFSFSGNGRLRGVCALYLSPLTSPVTAAEAATKETLTGKEIFRREIRLLPWFLLQIIPGLNLLARFQVRKRRLGSAVAELTDVKK